MILRNLIYILQSENYYSRRFLKFAYSHLKWWKLEDRQKIVWTAKARAIWILSTVLFWTLAGSSFLLWHLQGLLAIPFLLATLPFLIAVSLAILSPLDSILKQKKIDAAAKILARKKIIGIGIAGSYGKTSAKEILASILSRKFEILKTPENINTDIGIADFILGNEARFKDGSLFIVEMGAYRKGEIAKTCRMVRPSYSILTGINESHLERFGSLENIIRAKFELPENTQTLSLLNFDDDNIRKNHGRFPIGKSSGVSKEDARNIRFKENFGGLEFEFEGEKFETQLLAEHNIALIMLGARIARELSMSKEEIIDGVKNIQPIEHRLQPIYNPHTDIMVIDDSYNGNLDGIKSGLQLLQRAPGRKVVLTPGLVELGPRMEAIHMEIGALYAEKADLVMLIKSPMADSIIRGMEKNGFMDYTVYENTQKAHSDLGNVLKKGDTIIFQNDLTDNYF
jgi:UDP-N-acetylmuramoyl-tripeptide--D-alanyl-D-alanine ligase